MGYPDDRADRLADWVREMDLKDQVVITGSTLVLEEIRERRSDLPFPVDETLLREGSPESAYKAAMDLVWAYLPQQVSPAPDGKDEHVRIVGLAEKVAETIRRYHPEVGS